MSHVLHPETAAVLLEAFGAGFVLDRLVPYALEQARLGACCCALSWSSLTSRCSADAAGEGVLAGATLRLLLTQLGAPLGVRHIVLPLAQQLERAADSECSLALASLTLFLL